MELEVIISRREVIESSQAILKRIFEQGKLIHAQRRGLQKISDEFSR